MTAARVILLLLKTPENEGMLEVTNAICETAPTPRLQIRTVARFNPGHGLAHLTWESEPAAYHGEEKWSFLVRKSDKQ
jgi:hypothetical protein